MNVIFSQELPSTLNNNKSTCTSILFTITMYCVWLHNIPFHSPSLLHRRILPQLELYRNRPMKLGAIFLNVEEVSIHFLLLTYSLTHLLLPPPPPLLVFSNRPSFFQDFMNYSNYFKNMSNQFKLMEEGGTEFFAVRTMYNSIMCVFLVPMIPNMLFFLYFLDCTIQTAR